MVRELKGSIIYDCDSREHFKILKVKELAFGLLDTLIRTEDGSEFWIFIHDNTRELRILKAWDKHRELGNSIEVISYLKEVDWIELTTEDKKYYVF